MRTATKDVIYIYIWISSFFGRRSAQNDLYHECAKLLYETKNTVKYSFFFNPHAFREPLTAIKLWRWQMGLTFVLAPKTHSIDSKTNIISRRSIHSHVNNNSGWSLVFLFICCFFYSLSSFYTIFRSIVWILLQSIKCLQILTLVLLTFQIRPYNYWVYAMQSRLIRLWTP